MTTDLTSQKRAFGHDVLGPVFAQFCRDLIVWVRSSPAPEDTAVLFAARGGLRLFHIARTFAERTGLDFGGATTNGLMVSRIQVMRAMLLRTDAALDEFSRYCAKRTLREAVALLAAGSPALEHLKDLAGPYDRARLMQVINGDDALGKALRADISQQEHLLLEHLRTVSASRQRVLLGDTGLFGSTFHVIASAMPEWRTANLMFGRSFYRESTKSHDLRTFGVGFQSSRFSMRDPVSAVIRHWYLVESIFEPPIASVERLAARAPSWTDPDWQTAICDRSNPHYDGILTYIEQLTPQDLSKVDIRGRTAALELARKILTPTRNDIAVLEIEAQAPSPGDTQEITALQETGPSIKARLASIKKANWQEGQTRRAFPAASTIYLTSVALARVIRSAL